MTRKFNAGPLIPFLGVPAPTAPTVAQLALRYNLPIILARVERVRGAHFHAVIEPAFYAENTGDEEKDIETCLTRINDRMSEWVQEKPEQWFWIHRRWPDKGLNKPLERAK